MRPLSGCLCVLDGMTVMHNLAHVENMLCTLSLARLSDHIHSALRADIHRHCFLEEPALNSSLSSFSFPGSLHAFFLQMSNCTIVVYFFFYPRSLVPSAALWALVLWVQQQSRLRSSRLTTSRPLASINLSPLFLPVEQD